MAKQPTRGIAKPQVTPEAPKQGEARFKVRAVRDGYYDHIRRREGDVFVVNESAFSDAHGDPAVTHRRAGWMERVNERTPERVTGSQDAVDRVNNQLREERLPQGTQFARDDENDPLR